MTDGVEIVPALEGHYSGATSVNFEEQWPTVFFASKLLWALPRAVVDHQTTTGKTTVTVNLSTFKN